MRDLIREWAGYILTALLGVIATHLKAITRSRVSQGERLGAVEKRLAKIEAKLGIRRKPRDLEDEEPADTGGIPKP